MPPPQQPEPTSAQPVAAGTRSHARAARPVATPLKPPIQSEDEALARPLIEFTPKDVWRIRDAVQGTQIFGATGSGKTSGSGQALAVAFLRAGFGGLVLTAKQRDLEEWGKYFKAAQRPVSDMIVFGPEGDSQFNFLSHEVTRLREGKGSVHNIVTLFTTALSTGGTAVSDNDPYWNDSLRELLMHAVELAYAAQGTVRLADLARLIAEAPQSAAEARSARWRQSFTWRLLRKADRTRQELTDDAYRDLRLTVAYWMEDFPNLSEKTRSIIVSSFTSKASTLLRRPLRSLLCDATSPEVEPSRTHEGKVIVLALPVKEYGEVGRFAQILYKTVWQRATERRSLTGDWMPVFLWADESQYFITSEDLLFQQTARSAMASTVYLTQNIANYQMALGGRHAQAAAESLLGNLQTKIFHANGDPATNEWAEREFGRTQQRRQSRTMAFDSQARDHLTGGSQDVFEPAVPAARFTTLRKGGPEHDLLVDGIIFQGGRRWAQDLELTSDAGHLNYRLVAFPQRLSTSPAP